MKEVHSCCCTEYRFTCVSHKTCGGQYTKMTLTVNEKDCVLSQMGSRSYGLSSHPQLLKHQSHKRYAEEDIDKHHTQ